MEHSDAFPLLELAFKAYLLEGRDPMNRSKARVSTYRIYYVDPNGRLGLHRDIDCADDQMAIEQARRHWPAGLVEVWQGQRLVGRFSAHPANSDKQEQRSGVLC